MIKSFFTAIVAAYMAFVGSFGATTKAPIVTTVTVNASTTLIQSESASSSDSLIDKQRQKQEKKVSLEAKQQPTNSASEFEPTPSPQPTAPSSLQSTGSNMAENFSQPLQLAIKDFLDYYRKIVQLTSDYQSIPESRIKDLEKLVAGNQALLPLAPDGDMRELTENIIALYQNDITQTQSYVNIYYGIASTYEKTVIQPWDDYLRQVQKGGYVSREAFVQNIKSLQQGYEATSDFSSVMATQSQKYRAYVDKRDAEYDHIFGLMANNIAAGISNPAPPTQYIYVTQAPAMPRSISCTTQALNTQMAVTNCY